MGIFNNVMHDNNPGQPQHQADNESMRGHEQQPMNMRMDFGTYIDSNGHNQQAPPNMSANLQNQQNDMNPASLQNKQGPNSHKYYLNKERSR